MSARLIAGFDAVSRRPRLSLQLDLCRHLLAQLRRRVSGANEASTAELVLDETELAGGAAQPAREEAEALAEASTLYKLLAQCAYMQRDVMAGLYASLLCTHTAELSCSGISLSPLSPSPYLTHSASRWRARAVTVWHIGVAYANLMAACITLGKWAVVRDYYDVANQWLHSLRCVRGPVQASAAAPRLRSQVPADALARRQGGHGCAPPAP